MNISEFAKGQSSVVYDGTCKARLESGGITIHSVQSTAIKTDCY